MLDPHAQALIDFCVTNKVPYFNELAPDIARAAYLAGRDFTQLAPEPVGAVQDMQVPGLDGEPPVRIRLYRPELAQDSAIEGLAQGSKIEGLAQGAATTGHAQVSKTGGADAAGLLPVTILLHGGGWVIGSLETHDALCRQLVNRAGCAVVAVDYRLAPEHPFPAAVQDGLAVLQWVLNAGAQAGLDATRMAVAGDSAGGNLAAVLALAHRDLCRQSGGQLAPLRAQVLVYPAVQFGELTESARQWGEGYLLNLADLAYFQRHYLGSTGPVTPDWRHSPLHASDHTELAPAIIVTAGHDPLRDDGQRYAAALATAGNPLTYVCFERQIHGFLLMTRLLPEANTAVDWLAASLRRALQ